MFPKECHDDDCDDEYVFYDDDYVDDDGDDDDDNGECHGHCSCLSVNKMLTYVL